MAAPHRVALRVRERTEAALIQHRLGVVDRDGVVADSAVLEALACGCTPLVTDTPALRAIVGDALARAVKDLDDGSGDPFRVPAAARRALLPRQYRVAVYSGMAGCAGFAALDASLIVGTLLVAGRANWVTALAIAVSSGRIALCARAAVASQQNT